MLCLSVVCEDCLFDHTGRGKRRNTHTVIGMFQSLHTQLSPKGTQPRVRLLLALGETIRVWSTEGFITPLISVREACVLDIL